MSPHEKVRQFLDTEITNGFTVFDDASWLAAQVLWAQAAARCGHRPGSEMLYERLLPWRDQFATTHVTVNGGVGHYLGMLAHTLGLHDEADRWFAKSVASPRGDGSAVLRRVEPDRSGPVCSSTETSPETSHRREPWWMLRFPSRRSVATATSNTTAGLCSPC